MTETSALARAKPKLDSAIADLRTVVADAEMLGFMSAVQLAAKRVLAAYDGEDEAEGATVPNPMVLVCAPDHPRGWRYHLGTYAERNERIRYVLDHGLQAGYSLQASDVGDYPVDLCANVRGTRMLFSLNVTCGKCGDFGCHLVQVPDEWLHTSEPYLVRRCGCGDTWRQYPQLIDHIGRPLT